MLRSMMGQKRPSSNLPSSYSTTTSVPNVKEHTSVRMTSFTSARRSFMAAWIAAPSATASSGFSLVSGNLRNSLIRKSLTTDSLVAPPISNTSSMSDSFSPASARLFFTGSLIFINSSSHSSSYSFKAISAVLFSSPSISSMVTAV